MSCGYSGYGRYGGYDNYYNSQGFGGYDPYQGYGGYESYDRSNDLYGNGGHDNYDAHSTNKSRYYNPYHRRGRGNGYGGRSRGRDAYSRYESDRGYGMSRGYEDAYEDEYTSDMPEMMGGGRFPPGGRNSSPSTYDNEDSEFGSNYGDRGDSPVPDADI
jgi:hypothetical protein